MIVVIIILNNHDKYLVELHAGPLSARDGCRSLRGVQLRVRQQQVRKHLYHNMLCKATFITKYSKIPNEVGNDNLCDKIFYCKKLPSP